MIQYATLLRDMQDFFNTIQEGVDSLGALGRYLLAIGVFILGKMVAKSLSKLAEKGLNKTQIDDKIASYLGHKGAAEKAVSQFIYFLLLLFVVIISLDVANLQNVSGSIQNMLNDFLGFVPNLVGAGLLLYLVILAAKIVKNLVKGALETAKLDERLGSKVEAKSSISEAIAIAVSSLLVLLFIPGILGALGIDAVSEPVSGVVDGLLVNVGGIFGAALLITVAFFVGNIAKQLVVSLLQSFGADSWPEKLGLDVPSEGPRSLSSVVGFIVMTSIVVVLFGSALTLLDIELLSGVSEVFVDGFFNLLTAILILGFGVLLARFASNSLADKNAMLAKVARIGIIIFAVVVALDRSQIAPDLTGLPYQFAIYALATAAGIGGAIAIGLGGKDFVRDYLSKKQ